MRIRVWVRCSAGYAQLGADDPDQQQLREQLIIGYLPVAEHVARRFAGRGELRAGKVPLRDLADRSAQRRCPRPHP